MIPGVLLPFRLHDNIWQPFLRVSDRGLCTYIIFPHQKAICSFVTELNHLYRTFHQLLHFYCFSCNELDYKTLYLYIICTMLGQRRCINVLQIFCASWAAITVYMSKCLLACCCQAVTKSMVLTTNNYLFVFAIDCVASKSKYNKICENYLQILTEKMQTSSCVPGWRQHVQSILSGAPHQGQVRVNSSTDSSRRLVVRVGICAYQAMAGGGIKHTNNAT